VAAIQVMLYRLLEDRLLDDRMLDDRPLDDRVACIRGLTWVTQVLCVTLCDVFVHRRDTNHLDIV
jgi:hypothetical protein